MSFIFINKSFKTQKFYLNFKEFIKKFKNEGKVPFYRGKKNFKGRKFEHIAPPPIETAYLKKR